MMANRKPDVAIGLALAASILLLFVFPPLGVMGCIGLLIVAPPWGRSYGERAVISLLILVGVVAIAVPRASTVPLTTLTAHLGLAAFTLVAVALRFVPRFKATLPRVSPVDIAIALFAAATVAWLLSAYVGRNAYELLSGMFFSGWDNQGHFTPFANTYEVGATLWPTIDGSIAWNQWYPSLHSTLWSLAQLASQAGSELLDRPGLLWPYLVWTSASFALSMAALAWIATDLAARGADVLKAGAKATRLARLIALVAVAAFATLGSPAWLFNYGFTNFVMAVAIMATTAYLSARSWRSARTIGWLLLPLGALSINGMWTPLVAGLVPAGVIVLVALWRIRRWLAPTWAVLAAGIVGGTVVLQSRAIAEVAPGESGSFLEDLGAIGIGMAPFNIGAAFAAPIVAVLVAVILLRQRRWPLAVAVAGTSIMVTLFLFVTFYAAGLAGVPRLYNYYVLKTLDALLLANAPLLAALVALAMAFAVTLVRRRANVSTATVALALVAGLALAVTAFGYVGPRPTEYAPGFTGAPGLEAAAKRNAGVADSLVGEAIIEAQRAATPYADKTTMLWDGSGTLPNLWLASLHGVLSVDQQTFYRDLPEFPYDSATLEYVQFQQAVQPNLNLAILWFRDVSGELLVPVGESRPDRVTVVRVPMRSSPLCLECSN